MNPPDRPLLLQADDITRSFNGRRVLGPAGLQLRAGSVHAVLGKNGAGKSTLMKILAGLDRPDGGALQLEGQRLTSSTVRSHEAAGIAFVPQELTVFPGLTAADQMLLGDRYPTSALGVVRRRRGEREAARTLARLHADIDPEAPVDLLSVPQLRTLMIARAIHMDAKVIVLDEPTEAFTAPEVAGLFDVLRGLRDRGLGIVYVSHRLSEVFSLADTVTVLRDGKVVIEGETLQETTAETVVDAIVSDPQGSAPVVASKVRLGRDRAATTEPTPASQASTLLSVTPPGGGEPLALHAGQVTGLAGLVGSGRSSILRRLAGVDEGGTTRPDVAFLPEDRVRLGLLPGLTVRENIAIAGLHRFRSRRTLRLSRSRETELCKGVMAAVGLPSSALDSTVDSLSGGNQQKALLARGMFGGARLWLLDEPTVGLDVQARRQVLSLVIDVARGTLADGATTDSPSAAVLTSSDLDDLIETCDVVYLVHDGRVHHHLVAPFTEEQLMLFTAFAAPEESAMVPG